MQQKQNGTTPAERTIGFGASVDYVRLNKSNIETGRQLWTTITPQNAVPGSIQAAMCGKGVREVATNGVEAVVIRGFRSNAVPISKAV